MIPIAVGASLDPLDGVGDAFDDAGVERMAAARKNAAQVDFQSVGEELQRRDAAVLGLTEPVCPAHAWPRRAAGPAS